MLSQFLALSGDTSHSSPQTFLKMIPWQVFHQSIKLIVALKDVSPRAAANASALASKRGPLTGSSLVLTCLNH
jgi:hypothetical protein